MQAEQKVRPNFWWAVGQAFGVEPMQALAAVRTAEQAGLTQREREKFENEKR